MGMVDHRLTPKVDDGITYLRFYFAMYTCNPFWKKYVISWHGFPGIGGRMPLSIAYLQKSIHWHEIFVIIIIMIAQHELKCPYTAP